MLEPGLHSLSPRSLALPLGKLQSLGVSLFLLKQSHKQERLAHVQRKDSENLGISFPNFRPSWVIPVTELELAVGMCVETDLVTDRKTIHRHAR